MNPQTPLFSVIVANYNNGKYLTELVESVFKQTYLHWELVIADDCSKDDSLEILKKYEQDSRIKIVKHNHNKGAAAAFRTAADHAQGEIIGMLGADDALTPNALEVMTKAHQENPNTSLIYSTLNFCDEQLNILDLKQIGVGQVEENSSLIFGFRATNFATFKKEFYLQTTGFDVNFRAALDMDIYLKLEEVGKTLFVDQPLYLYRKNPNGISQTNSHYTSRLFALYAVLKAYQRRKKTGFLNISRKKYEEYAKIYYFKEAEAMTLKKRKKNAFYFLLRTLWLNPLHIFDKHWWHLLALNFNLQKTLNSNIHIPNFWNKNDK